MNNLVLGSFQEENHNSPKILSSTYSTMLELCLRAIHKAMDRLRNTSLVRSNKH